MRYLLIVAVVALLLAPYAAYAGCNSCGKSSCNSCQAKPSCDKCQDGCKSGCTDKCHKSCGDKCGKCKSGCNSCSAPKCGKCKSGCNSCEKPKCGTCGSNKCGGGCATQSCAQPCACDAWEPYCGCGDITSLCISITACEGTAGPLKLALRDPQFNTVTTIELAGPIEGYYNYTYTFDKPVAASMLYEATLINDTEDPATLTSVRVVGNGNCFFWTFVEHTCPGAVIGPGGCKRMVIY